ncbi:MAG: hypothetical protein AAFP86_15995, partial [Planctomycetota bacterium]
ADRMRLALERVANGALALALPPRLTPFAFPILTSRLREKVSSESAEKRIRRLASQLQRAADA